MGGGFSKTINASTGNIKNDEDNPHLQLMEDANSTDNLQAENERLRKILHDNGYIDPEEEKEKEKKKKKKKKKKGDKKKGDNADSNSGDDQTVNSATKTDDDNDTSNQPKDINKSDIDVVSVGNLSNETALITESTETIESTIVTKIHMKKDISLSNVFNVVNQKLDGQVFSVDEEKKSSLDKEL